MPAKGRWRHRSWHGAAQPFARMMVVTKGASVPETGQDLRRYPRIRSDIRVRAFTPPDFPALDGFGRGYDISEAGMAIYVPLRLAPEEEVLVVFQVPLLSEKLGLRGRVRYARDFRYGIEFAALDERDRQELRRALDHLAVIGATQSA